MGDHRRNGWYSIGGVTTGVGGAIFAGWYIAVNSAGPHRGMLAAPTYVALAFFVIGSGIVAATMRGLLPMAKRKKKKSGRVTPPKDRPGSRAMIPHTPAAPAPPGSGVVIRDSDQILIDGLTYVGPGNAVDAANSTNVTAKNIRHYPTKPQASSPNVENDKDVKENGPADTDE